MEDENGIKNCVYDIFDERCVEGKINTLYYNNTYTCTKCKKHGVFLHEIYTNFIFLSYSEYKNCATCSMKPI